MYNTSRRRVSSFIIRNGMKKYKHLTVKWLPISNKQQYNDQVLVTVGIIHN